MFGPRFSTTNKCSEDALGSCFFKQHGSLVVGGRGTSKMTDLHKLYQHISTYWIILGVLLLAPRFFFVFSAVWLKHALIPSQPLDIHSPEHCTEWYLPGWYQPVTFPRCAGFWPIPGKCCDSFFGGNKNTSNDWLVGGWTNPFEKYARQIGSFPQVGMKIKIFETTT